MGKRIVSAFAILVILLLCVGCNFSADPYPSDDNQQTANESISKSDLLQKQLDNMGLNNAAVTQKENGTFTVENGGSEGCAYLLADSVNHSGNNVHDTYLAIETGSEILIKAIPVSEDTASYSDLMYVCDIDGDNTDEIVIQQSVGLAGGAGQYASSVLKAENGEIREIFFSSSEDCLYDTGFTVIPENGFSIKVQNRFTKYEKRLDSETAKSYTGPVFNENGDVIITGEQKLDIYDSFCKFAPEDTDGDGIFELVCRQYASVYGHSDFIGLCVSTLKFNSETNCFEVIGAEFDEADK